ncbi:MAG: hypothetical protein FWF29_04505 [Treponema sp.]|nr:hypothetical protein [Treponema sp.]
MKKIIIAILIFFLFCFSVSAGGSTDETPAQAVNNDWVLAITALDTSALPASQLSVIDIFMRNLTSKIQAVNYRLRISPEYAYYEDYAWSRDRNTAAKALEAKQNERTALLYQGDPSWRYRQNLKKKDAEIAVLRDTLRQKEESKPLVNNTPNFKITDGNISGNFPAAPVSGGEYNFCQTQNADGFLAGTAVEFYGRYYVTLKLYAKYTRSYIYDDDVIFSADDIDAASNEISGRLNVVLAGNKPAAVAVHATPPETLVLINQSFAGRGEVPPFELPPGKITVALSADNYNSQTVEEDLAPDELTDISVSLGPQVKGDVDVTVPGKPGSLVYQGAMYVGKAPLTLKLPINQLDYVDVLAPGGEEARAVYNTPELPNQGLTISLNPILHPPAGSQRVNKARNRYYWAWGGTWLTGIAAWLAYGMSDSYGKAYSASGSPALYPNSNTMYYISLGAAGLVGAAVIYEIYQMYKYVHTSSEYTTPIIKTEMKN